MVQAEIIAVFHAVEAEQVQREREARNKENAAVKGTKYTLVSAVTSFAGTILFRSRKQRETPDTLFLFPLPYNFTVFVFALKNSR